MPGPNGVELIEAARRARPGLRAVLMTAFGDSFTHCDGVANSFTWEYLLERLNPALEVLNFGVGGYGTDQALLRYELEGMAFHPHIAILGFLPENIHRVVSVFRPFYFPMTGIPMSKPRFKPHQAPLTFKRSDQIELNDRFNPDSEAFQIVARVFSRFRDESFRSGSLPLALILPDIDDICFSHAFASISMLALSLAERGAAGHAARQSPGPVA